MSAQVFEPKGSRYQIGETVQVQIRVEDSGIGIEKSKFKTIFDHFSRLTPAYEGLYKGAGLGLYTVKQYVSAMGGSISVESEVGEGACFTLVLPFIVSAQVSKRPDQLPMPVDAFSTIASSDKVIAKVLVVEDHQVAALAVVSTLKSLGCLVETAATGAQAVHQAQGNDYDLILMDIGLPDFSGIEAAEKILAGAKVPVPIVALTGHANNPEKRKEIFAAGIADVICKPALAPTLASIVQHHVPQTAESILTEAKGVDVLSTDQEQQDVIDWEACVKLCQNDPALARHLISVFSEELQLSRMRIGEYFHAKDWQALGAELHRVCGSVRYLKLPKLERAFNSFYQQAGIPGEIELRTKSSIDTIRDGGLSRGSRAKAPP